MIKSNKVSLWLGKFETSDEFYEYVDVKYDEDGNYIKSVFQEEFEITRYDLDASEKDWILERCEDIDSLLAGFSYDDEIIPKFAKIIENKRLKEYNSIFLLYSFEYGPVSRFSTK